MGLNEVGFFSDLPYGKASEVELKSVARSFIGDDKFKVITYLEMGAVIAIAPGAFTDILSTKKKYIPPLRIMTDGQYMWPSHLIYYLQNYDISIPEEFVKHMQNNNWVVPPVDMEVFKT